LKVNSSGLGRKGSQQSFDGWTVEWEKSNSVLPQVSGSTCCSCNEVASAYSILSKHTEKSHRGKFSLNKTSVVNTAINGGELRPDEDDEDKSETKSKEVRPTSYADDGGSLFSYGRAQYGDANLWVDGCCINDCNLGK
jgi:hypothetical protein